MANDVVELDFYFDPSCGWAWRTSTWIRLVAKERPIKIDWKLFSLAVVNAPEDWRNDKSVGHMRGVNMLRTLLLAGRQGGNAALDRLAVAYGNASHGRKVDIREPAVQAQCLDEAGLSRTLYEEAQADPSTETELVASTKTAIEKLSVFGVPTLALAGSNVAIFGPVIQPVPVGQAALDLWDFVHFSLKQPHLYEMKRTRVNYDRPQFADVEGLPVEAPVLAG